MSQSKPIDIIQYRKVILDKGTFFKDLGTTSVAWVKANPKIWDIIIVDVSENQRHHMENRLLNLYEEDRPWSFDKTHPLVEKNIAYWFDKKTLVTGYILKSNTDIYKPIFQPCKEKLNHELRREIRYNAKFIVADMRQKLYKKILLGISKLNILPKEIIYKIVYLTYDPNFYLKL